MKLLKNLCASLNVAAAVVIHQPSSEVFNSFDKLVLLSSGRCIYCDKISKIRTFYETHVKETMPENHLLPGDLLKRASNWEQKPASDEESAALVPTTCTTSRVQSEPPLHWKFRTVFYRNLLNHHVRNLTNLVARLAIYAATSILIGLIFWQVAAPPEDGSSLSNAEGQAVVGAGLFITQTAFLLPFAQISTFFFDKKVFAAESGE
jgi:hypothetical protein